MSARHVSPPVGGAGSGIGLLDGDMAVTIKVGHFCGLGSSTLFKNWLTKIAPDLLDRLLNNPKKGCKSRQEKMIEIHKELYVRKLGDRLEKFVQEQFPYMIQVLPDAPKPSASKTIAMPKAQQITHIEDLNRHGVFKHYRPDLLTFPQKYIIVGEPAVIADMVRNFIHDKVGVDHIVIDNTAYIEYFHKRFSDVAGKIKPEDREIWAYRQRIGQKNGK